MWDKFCKQMLRHFIVRASIIMAYACVVFANFKQVQLRTNLPSLKMQSREHTQETFMHQCNHRGAEIRCLVLLKIHRAKCCKWFKTFRIKSPTSTGGVWAIPIQDCLQVITLSKFQFTVRMTPYDIKTLGKGSSRKWLGAMWHKAVSLINVHNFVIIYGQFDA